MKIAVIPARGGSKRIPRKNIQHFAGKPIIAYSIGIARDSGLFDRVVVSTDDEEIASVARQWGAETPFMRPSELADDFTCTNAVVKHAVQWFCEQGEAVTHACCIYATSPFLRVQDLCKAYGKLVASNKSFIFSVTTFPHPVQRGLRIGTEGTVDPLYPQYRMTRSQDLGEVFHDAGQFYWGTRQAFLEDTVLFSSASLAYVLPRYLVQDIDTPEDWERAELMYRAWQLGGDCV